MKQLCLISAADKKASIFLYDDIYSWSDSSSSKIASAINDCETKGVKKLDVYVNSNGGSVSEGIAIFRNFERCSMEVTIHVDGIAASMAACLVQTPGAKRKMAKHAKLMMHRVSGFAKGNPDEVKEAIKVWEDFENSLINIIAENTGMKDADVKAKWFDGVDHWINATDALALKLIDEIEEGKVKKSPSNISNPIEVYNFYQSEINQTINSNTEEMDLTKLINSLGLQAGSTEDQVMAAVTNAMAENKRLKGEVTSKDQRITELENAEKEANKIKVKTLIDNAITAKKFTEEQRESYTALAEANYDHAKKAIDAMAAYNPLSKVPGGDGSDPVIPENRKDWNFSKWQKEDGKGLENIMKNHVEVYKALYKKQFGREPQL